MIQTFPLNVPPRLIQEYKKIVRKHKTEGGYQRKLAKQLVVNIKYLNDLLVKGIEPTDRTEKGQAVRVKLFLPRQHKKPSNRIPLPLPYYKKKWNQLPPAERDQVIQEYIEQKEQHGSN